MKKHIKTREPSALMPRRNLSKHIIRDSLMTQNFLLQIRHIDIDDLIPYKNQARLKFNDNKIESLMNSIERHGLRQPLTVIMSNDQVGKYEVVSGERRLKACILLKYEKIPCIITDNIGQADEVALVENVQREDLHPIELGIAYSKLIQSNLNYTQETIASKIGVPRTQVGEYIKFSKLDKKIANILISNEINGREILRQLIKLPNIESQEKLLENLLSNKSNNKIIISKKINLLNINYNDSHISIMKKDMSNLSNENLIKIKDYLNKILIEIEDELEK